VPDDTQRIPLSLRISQIRSVIPLLPHPVRTAQTEITGPPSAWSGPDPGGQVGPRDMASEALCITSVWAMSL